MSVFARRRHPALRADEGIDAKLRWRSWRRFSPSFKPDGILTAGNTSQITDGAAAVLLMSREGA